MNMRMAKSLLVWIMQRSFSMCAKDCFPYAESKVTVSGCELTVSCRLCPWLLKLSVCMILLRRGRGQKTRIILPLDYYWSWLINLPPDLANCWQTDILKITWKWRVDSPLSTNNLEAIDYVVCISSVIQATPSSVSSDMPTKNLFAWLKLISIHR